MKTQGEPREANPKLFNKPKAFEFLTLKIKQVKNEPNIKKLQTSQRRNLT